MTGQQLLEMLQSLDEEALQKTIMTEIGVNKANHIHGIEVELATILDDSILDCSAILANNRGNLESILLLI